MVLGIVDTDSLAGNDDSSFMQFMHACHFIKRPWRYIFTHLGHTFCKTHFLVLTTNLKLKTHGEPILVDFWAQKGVF